MLCWFTWATVNVGDSRAMLSMDMGFSRELLSRSLLKALKVAETARRYIPRLKVWCENLPKAHVQNNMPLHEVLEFGL